LRIAADAEDLSDCQAQWVAMTRDELPVSPYRGEEGEGLLFPSDACFQPMALARRKAQWALVRGAQLFEHSPASSIIKDQVITRGGAIRAPVVVVCIDGGLEHLLPDLRGRVRTARVQMLATAPTQEIHLSRPVHARLGNDYWQQCPNGCVVLAGCRDVGGDEEWTQHRDTTPRVQEALERLLREHLGVKAAITHRWAANIGYHDSPLPLLERLPSGAVVCGAYNGMGQVIGRLYGRQALALALDEMVEPALLA
jgi:glycine/D-amino acid oxidase-like deaminating enzyme